MEVKNILICKFFYQTGPQKFVNKIYITLSVKKCYEESDLLTIQLGFEPPPTKTTNKIMVFRIVFSLWIVAQVIKTRMVKTSFCIVRRSLVRSPS